jgi:PLP dependent protein
MTILSPYPDLEQRLASVRAEIEAACARAGRDPEAVRIVAVTKEHPPEILSRSLEAGLTDLGENRVEGLEGRLALPGADRARWHMIGRLQRRQAPWLRGRVALLHSLDSLRLAERLQRTRESGSPVLPVLLQVNVSREEAKAGFAPDELVDAAGQILEMDSLSPEGLMTMAPLTDDKAVLRGCFAGLRQLQERLQLELPGWKGHELSMGMSNDFVLAVEEGSTLIRLGTVLFGERPHGDGLGPDGTPVTEMRARYS